MSKELEVIDNKDVKIVQQSPMELAQGFLQAGGDLASLEKMMELQERHESNLAKKAYHEAMSKFKANPPKILKDKNVSFGNTNYNHATLGKVVSEINKALSIHGLSTAWKTNQNELIEVTCTITHILGYSESTTLKAAPDNSGKKNDIQAIGSTVTYLQRYTILSLTGLATHDQDDDGNAAGRSDYERISEEQAIQLREIIESIEGETEEMFCKWAKIEKIEDGAAQFFDKYLSALKAKVGKK